MPRLARTGRCVWSLPSHGETKYATGRKGHIFCFPNTTPPGSPQQASECRCLPPLSRSPTTLSPPLSHRNILLVPGRNNLMEKGSGQKGPGCPFYSDDRLASKAQVRDTGQPKEARTKLWCRVYSTRPHVHPLSATPMDLARPPFTRMLKKDRKSHDAMQQLEKIYRSGSQLKVKPHKVLR